MGYQDHNNDGLPVFGKNNIEDGLPIFNQSPDATLKVSDFAGQSAQITSIPKPQTRQNELGQYGANVQAATTQKKAKDVNDAITNTANIWANQNKVKGESSSVYQNKVSELRKAVDKGDLIVSGNTLVRPKGKFDSFVQGITDAWNADKNADRILSLNDDDLIKHLNENKPEEYLPEKADPNSFLYGIGSALPTTGKALAGAAVGTAAAAALPETGGLSMEGAAPFLAWAMSVPDMAKQAKASALEQYYHKAKEQNPNISDKQALEEAKSASNGAYGEAIATGTALNFIGAHSLPPAAGEGFLKTAGKFLLKQPEVAAEAGAIGGAGSAAKDFIARASGISQKPNEIWDNMSDGMKQMATTQLAFDVGFGVLKVPKYLKAQANEVLSKIDPNELNTIANKAVETGTITPEQAEAATKDLAGYQEAQKKIVPTGNEEKDAVITGLIQKKINLEKSKERLDKSFHNDIDDEVEAINKKIEIAKNSDNPTSVETDDLTGEHNLNPKEYDKLNAQEKEGIQVDKDYGDTETEEVGKGEESKYKPVAYYFEEKGGIKLKHQIDVGEKTYTDKAKAQEVADRALKQHYYENGMEDNLKPQKGHPEKISQPIELSVEKETPKNVTVIKPEENKPPNVHENKPLTETETEAKSEQPKELSEADIELNKYKSGEEYKKADKEANDILNQRHELEKEKSQLIRNGENTEKVDAKIESLKNQENEANKKAADLLSTQKETIKKDIQIRNEEQEHEAGKPKVEFEKIPNTEFAKIDSGEIAKGAKKKYTDILKRKSIIDSLINCL